MFVTPAYNSPSKGFTFVRMGSVLSVLIACLIRATIVDAQEEEFGAVNAFGSISTSDNDDDSLLASLPTTSTFSSRNSVERELLFDIPSTGFVSVKSAKSGENVNINILKQINGPSICQKMEFRNTPPLSNNPSPMVGGSVFTLLLDDLYNDHHAWYNGFEYISYIPLPDTEFGNWLIGNSPGVDSGYIYLSTDRASSTPLELENGLDLRWNWLMNGKWAPQDRMKLVCVDEYKPGNKLFQIEYFDPKTGDHHVSRLIPDINPLIVDPELPSFNQNEEAPPQAAYLKKDLKSGMYHWEPISALKVLSTVGHPVTISTTRGSSSSGLLSALGVGNGANTGTTSILVSNEHAGESSWRLTYHKYNNSRAPFAYDNLEQVSDSDSGDEYLVLLRPGGFEKGYTVSPLTTTQMQDFNMGTTSELSGAKVGDYLWLWYSIPAFSSSSGVTQNAQLLVQCIAKEGTKSIFRYYPTDRVKQMRQKVLAHLTDVLTMEFAPVSSSSSSSATTAAASSVSVQWGGQKVNIHSVVSIGNDVYGFIRRHLVTKEGKPNGMSSCYFYHAAVSLPQALLYAAEIMCVLIGSKPLTLIQYTTQAEHQWKFPLVRELSRGIIAAKLMYGDAIDLDYQVTNYRNDESLVIFRSSRRYIAEGLVPFNASQALHPAPYPDSENPTPDEKMQIYNAWWNGYILGYPEYFVDSYCESFHNGLTVAQRRVQMKEGKKGVLLYLESVGQKQELIRLGLDPPLPKNQMDFIWRAAVLSTASGFLGE